MFTSFHFNHDDCFLISLINFFLSFLHWFKIFFYITFLDYHRFKDDASSFKTGYLMCGASRYRPLTQGCCACKYVYPKGIKKCCYGRVIPKRSWCIGVLTWGWHRYNPLTHGCCSGRRYYKRSQKCCHGLVIPRASTCVRPLKCGKYNYYPFTNGCCGGKKPSIDRARSAVMAESSPENPSACDHWDVGDIATTH